jgi:hypothetical protein
LENFAIDGETWGMKITNERYLLAAEGDSGRGSGPPDSALEGVG